MSCQSELFLHEPRWLKNVQGVRHHMPVSVQSWVYEPYSLTARLRSDYGNQVAVKLLHQQWQTPFLRERQILGQAEQRFCFIREVLLHVQNRPLILARTVIPRHSVKVARSNLSRLGSRPLGEILFGSPSLERMDMTVTLVKPQLWTNSIRENTLIEDSVWGRRTVYALDAQEILVSEFFLSDIL